MAVLGLPLAGLILGIRPHRLGQAGGRAPGDRRRGRRLASPAEIDLVPLLRFAPTQNSLSDQLQNVITEEFFPPAALAALDWSSHTRRPIPYD